MSRQGEKMIIDGWVGRWTDRQMDESSCVLALTCFPLPYILGPPICITCVAFHVALLHFISGIRVSTSA